MKNLIRNFIVLTIKNKRLLLYLVLSLFAGYFLLFSEFGIIKKMELQKQKKELFSNIELQKKLKDSLEQRIKIISEDKSEIERVARKYYMLIKPGEKVFIIRQDSVKK